MGLLVGVYPGSGYDGVDWKYLWGSRGTEVGVNWREGVQFIWR